MNQMCTPTRGQLMTGQDALRNGATSVTAGRSLIRRGIPLISEIFASNRYRTAMFGKWHLGDSYPNLPHQRGFEEAVYLMGWGVNSIADHWLNDNFDDWYRHNGKPRQYKGYCTDVWFDLAMEWMKERAAFSADGAAGIDRQIQGQVHGRMGQAARGAASPADKDGPG